MGYCYQHFTNKKSEMEIRAGIQIFLPSIKCYASESQALVNRKYLGEFDKKT